MASNFLSNFASAKKIFRREVIRHFQKSAGTGHEILTEEHLDQLPVPVARYLRYGGWVGKEIPKNFYVSLYGDFSLKPGKYMKVKVEQYSWLDQPARLFLISSPLFSGRHRMDENGAFMLIKLLGRFPLVDASGPEMDQAEQVTYLNDLCLIAPAALVHAPLSWETIDDRTVKVTLSQYSYHVSAILSFGEKGELINFVSYDRFSTPDGRNPKNYPWSTPVENYMLWEGLNIPGLAKAIWHYPEGDHCYAKFRVGTFVSNPKRPLF